MKKKWLIIADDLTGAADCAIAFGRHGFSTSVSWGEVLPPQEERTHVFSHNAESREFDAETSEKHHADLLEKLWNSDTYLYRKIDSTLRGQPAADIVATVKFLKARTGKALGIFAPAFPATGRVTRNGHVFVNDVELEETETWKYDHSYPSADMKEIIEKNGLKCAVLTLEQIHQGKDKLTNIINKLEESSHDIIVFDAEKKSDLEIIAQASLNDDVSRFFIGSAGLAHALVPLFEKPEKQPEISFTHQGGLLIAVGSLASVSREATKELAKARNIKHCLVNPDILLDSGKKLKAFADDVGTTLKNNQDVLIEIAVIGQPEVGQGPKLAKALAQCLKPYAGSIGGLAATGGETAGALMDAFGMNGICLFDEIEPGVSLGVTTGKIEIPIATKAGAFGNRHSLLNIFDRLSTVKKEGKLK